MIKRIEVMARVGGRIAPKPRRVESLEARTWMVGVHAMVRDLADEESEVIRGMEMASQTLTNATSSIKWLRFTGKSRFRSEAKPGDNVIVIWSDARQKTPSRVYRHSLILHQQEEARCTRFFVEECSDCEEIALSWVEFKELAQRIGVPGHIGPSSARPLKNAHSEALFSLWGE